MFARRCVIEPDGTAARAIPGREPAVRPLCAGVRFGRQMTGTVGREAELDVLRDFVASIAVGASALVLEGEAGVGKTTLWEAGTAEAEARGFRVLAARP